MICTFANREINVIDIHTPNPRMAPPVHDWCSACFAGVPVPGYAYACAGCGKPFDRQTPLLFRRGKRRVKFATPLRRQGSVLAGRNLVPARVATPP